MSVTMPEDLSSGVINLDEAFPHELGVVANSHENADYRHYAELRILSQRQRRNGNIQAAIITESRADSVYMGLPDELKW